MAAEATRTTPKTLIYRALDAAKAFKPDMEYEKDRCFATIDEVIKRLGLKGIPKPEHRVGISEDHFMLRKALWAFSGKQFDKHKALVEKIKLDPLDLKPSCHVAQVVHSIHQNDPKAALKFAGRMSSGERREYLTQIAVSFAVMHPTSAFRVYRQFISEMEFYKRHQKQIDKVAKALGKFHPEETIAFAKANASYVNRELLRIASVTDNKALLAEVLKIAKDKYDAGLLIEVAQAYGKYDLGTAHDILRLAVKLKKWDDELNGVVCCYAAIAKQYRDFPRLHNMILRHALDLLPKSLGLGIRKLVVEASYSDLHFALEVAGCLDDDRKSWVLRHLCFKLAATRPEDAVKVCRLIPSEEVKVEVYLFLAQFLAAQE